jgi:protein involved in plasmid replication-relaxation
MTTQPRLRITQRDIAIFESLSTARFLTAHAIEWLHFPGWQQRWEQHTALSRRRRYLPTPRVYGRLRQLEQENLIYRIVRPISQASVAAQRDDNAYTLREAGAMLLAEARGCSLDEIWYEELRERSVQNLAHSVLIGVLYAALRAKIESMVDIQLEDWRGDHLLSRGNYDCVSVPGMSNRNRDDRKWPVLPDATCVIRHSQGALRCFIELDRGRPAKTWREKIAAYRAYVGSAELRSRYAVSNFVLLVATTSPIYRRKLMTTTAAVLRQPSDRHLFTTLADLHPLRIGSWVKIGSVTPTHMKGVKADRITYTIEETEHVLLR